MKLFNILACAAILSSTALPASAESMTFVSIPVGTRLPVTVASSSAGIVRAHLASTVKLPTGEIIPSGTLVMGHSESPNRISFDQLQLSNGTIIPIDSRLVSIGACGASKVMQVEIRQRAQVAVTGSVL